MNNIKKIHINHVKNGVQEILRQMHLDNFRPDYVVGITRGGLFPAIMISHYLKVPMHALDVSLRDNVQGGPESNCWMAADAFGALNPEDVVTIETWVKVPSISFNYQTNIIDNYETSNYTGDRWGIFVDGLIGPYPGKIVLSSFDDLKSINRIDDNIWHHIAVIRDSTGSIYLYVDGVLNDSGIESCIR